MAHSRTWDNTAPASTDNAGLGYDEFQQFRVDVDERMQQAHVFSDSTTTDGEHKYDEVNSANTESAAYTIDLDDGWTHKVTLKHDVTFTFSMTTSPPSDFGRTLTLFLLQDDTGGRAVTWPASVDWPYGTEPILDTTADKMSILQFLTIDGGTTWYGALVGTQFG